jgi:Zn-dependent protease
MDTGKIAATIYEISVWLVPLVIATTLHEASHGYAALRFGDDTALRAGRISINPLRHVDPFGTFILPGLLLLASGGQFAFGFAKPVPVNFWRLRNPKRDMIWVAAAGPATNIALGIVTGLLFHFVQVMPPPAADWFAANFVNSLQINAILAVFNMIPIPPLDGGRVAVGILPRPLAEPLARLERWGLFIILGAVFLLPFVGSKLGLDLNVLPWLLGPPVDALIRMIATLTGNA